jgi:hypothetical protein
MSATSLDGGIQIAVFTNAGVNLRVIKSSDQWHIFSIFNSASPTHSASAIITDAEAATLAKAILQHTNPKEQQ